MWAASLRVFSLCLCVCVSSGEWAKIGNLVYRVIDFPRCTGNGWLLILWDNDVTPDGAGCLLTHDNVRGALSPNAGQITHSLAPLSSLFPPPVFSSIANAPVNPASNHHRWAIRLNIFAALYAIMHKYLHFNFNIFSIHIGFSLHTAFV